MPTFAVFANDTFCGVAETETPSDAIQAIADAVGTRDIGEEKTGTDGMTATDAGQFVLHLRDICARNEADMRDAVMEFFNCREAEISEEGKIWISDPQAGHWLDADGLSEFIAWIVNR